MNTLPSRFFRRFYLSRDGHPQPNFRILLDIPPYSPDTGSFYVEVVRIAYLFDWNDLALTLRTPARTVSSKGCEGTGRLVVTSNLGLAQIRRTNERAMESVVQRLVFFCEGQQERLLNPI